MVSVLRGCGLWRGLVRQPANLRTEPSSFDVGISSRMLFVFRDCGLWRGLVRRLEDLYIMLAELDA